MALISREGFKDFIDHPGTACAVCRTAEGEVVLVHVERQDGVYTWEVPGGKRRRGEAPADAASREILEETGYSASRLVPLCSITSCTGLTNEVVELVECRVRRVSEERAHPIALFPEEKVIELIRSGAIKDFKTVTAFLWLAAFGSRFREEPL